MKIVSFEVAEQLRFGIALEAGVRDLTDKLGAGIHSVREALAHGATDQMQRFADENTVDYGFDEVTLLPPVPFPEKIICVGVNYGHRNEEYKDGSPPPQFPSVFPRFPGSFVGHDSHLLRPLESEQLDYEGEIAIIIGRTGRRIAQEHAEAHIAGLTCLNEGTIRDWVRHGKFNVTQGKNFDASGAMGPWLVTADEFDDYGQLEVITRVNGEERQRDSTANLMFSFRYLIHYISTWTTLQPGDVISTGTPIGAGVRFNPPRFLKAGDLVEVEVPGIGTLRNRVANEEAAC